MIRRLFLLPQKEASEIPHPQTEVYKNQYIVYTTQYML